MPITLADVLREHWPSYARANRTRLNAAHYRAVRSVLSCRTPMMGGRVYRCLGCSQVHYAYHSCNHRNCPQCGALDQQAWSAKQEAKLLPVPYFMVTFTLPAELRPIILAHPKELYDLILTESAGALRDIIATRYHGGESGFTSVLHTWGRQLQHHPHVHAIVPALGYNAEKEAIITPPHNEFLIHHRPLAERFRNRLRIALQSRHPPLYNRLTPRARQSFSPHTTWNVNLQHVGRGKSAIRYLAAYATRSAFSAQRLLGYDQSGNRLFLRWISSETGKAGTLHLAPHEFIRRWLLHVLPKGFTRIRHYGFLSSAARKKRLKIRLLLGELRPEPEPVLPEHEVPNCPHCGGTLIHWFDLPRIYPVRGPPPSTSPSFAASS